MRYLFLNQSTRNATIMTRSRNRTKQAMMTMGALLCLDLWQKPANLILSDDLGRCLPGQYQHFLPISVDVKLSRADNGGQLRILQDGCP